MSGGRRHRGGLKKGIKGGGQVKAGGTRKHQMGPLPNA